MLVTCHVVACGWLMLSERARPGSWLAADDVFAAWVDATEPTLDERHQPPTWVVGWWYLRAICN